VKLDYDAAAQAYARHRNVHPQVLRDLLKTGELEAGSRVLDVGCGTGNYTLALQTTAGCSCWGIDPSKRMLAAARAKSSWGHFGIGSAEHLPYAAESFDLVLSVDVIHHISNRPAYFTEAHRVLKKGGQVCTVTDSEQIIRQRQPLSVYFPETVGPELRRYPRVVDLQGMMVRAGFGNLNKTEVEFAHRLRDIQSYRDKVYSCLHLIPAEAFERGMRRMENDLRAGSILCASRYLLLWGTKGGE
jgi:SAM-dependent methyltransferase